jgi:hypothetical protein
MRNVYCILSVLFIVATIFACGSWLLPPLEVVSVSTDGDVKITFSTQPSEESVKKAFSMTEDGQAVTGRFTFTGSAVIFAPVNGLQDNRKYNIVVSTTAEDKKGNSLSRDFKYEFYTKQDMELPRIMEIIPADESDLAVQPDKITIAFSKQVDTASFEKAFSITPVATYVLEWNAGNSIVDIIPIKPLAEGARYKVTVNTALTDIRRNALLASFTSTFLYGLDRDAPEMSVRWESPGNVSGLLIPETVNTNIPCDSVLVVEFDKPVFIEAMTGFIEIHPSIGITVTPDLVAKNNARIQFNQKPEWDKGYLLKFKKGIADTFGNKTETETQYPLVFNAEKNRPVTYIGGVLNNNSNYEFINFISNYSPITLDVVYFDPSGHVEKSTELYYAFRISAEADCLSLVSAMQSVSISTRNSCAYISLRTIKFLTASDIEFDAINNLLDDNGDGKLCVLKIGVDIENTDNRGFIVFSIRRDIADNLGNTMIEALNFTLNKQ